jgi:hypothetical protein
MAIITLHCPHCQREALVRNGYASNGKHLSGCCACGRQCRENPALHAYLQACAKRARMRIKNASLLHGLTRTD